MKGISPLVATVLLIAATMSIAMIMSFWASSFVQSGLPEENQTQRKCQFSDFDIYQCFHNSTTSVMDITLQNLRKNPIDDMKVQLVFTNNSVSQQYSLGTLPGGAYQSYRLQDIPSFSKIIVIPFSCKDVVPDKEKACAGG